MTLCEIARSSPREPWNSSRLLGLAKPPSDFVFRPVYENRRFRDSVELLFVSNSDLVFVQEQQGSLFFFPKNDPDRESRLAADFSLVDERFREVYGIEFPPDFESHREIYVCYVLNPNIEDGSRVSRFQVRNDFTVDLSSEEVVVSWVSGGHNGGCLKFGPDGYLYISTGDARGPNPPDELRTGQDCSDLMASILRIDVNSDTKPYQIPHDNPFVGMKNVRPEIWAFGFRNPWKMSFDRKTGDLWVGDVGWDLWELVFKVEKGMNGGWSHMEGSQPILGDHPLGPSPISPPLMQHPHSEARSITGGYVYRGKRIPELKGAYIYGDYETGKVWALHAEGQRLTSVKEIADTSFKIVGFAEDNEGELYMMNHGVGIAVLEKNDHRGEFYTPFPTRLSETGLFNDTKSMQPAPGVIPYEINGRMWADGALSERLVAVPGDSRIRTSRRFSFPDNSVLVKTLFLDRNPGHSISRQRMETQILHLHKNQWQAYTYAWNEQGTDAELVPEEGASRQIEVKDPSSPGGNRSQKWRFASRSECQSCHNGHTDGFLAVNREQWNVGDQLERFHKIDLLDRDLSSRARLYVNPRDPNARLVERARHYLDINCGHCHRPNGGGLVPMDLRLETRMEQVKAFAPPLRGDFGILGGQVILPGQPWRSILYYRMAKTGSGRMPHLGSNRVDAIGTELIFQWIHSLDPGAEIQDQPDPLSIREPAEGLAVRRMMEQHQYPPEVKERILESIQLNPSPFIKELFTRFLPSNGDTNPATLSEILALDGDASAGEKWLGSVAGQICLTCHTYGNKGREIGPAFQNIGDRLNSVQILESILSPSKVIAPGFMAYTVITKDGAIFAGVLLEQGADKVVLRDLASQKQEIDVNEIAELKPMETSLMPTGLESGLSRQELADLVAFLVGDRTRANAR